MKSSSNGKVRSTESDGTSTDAIPFRGPQKDLTKQVEEILMNVDEDLVQHVEEDLLDIEVKAATIYRGPPQFKVYPMNSQPRGSVLIINNESFINDVFSRRTGSSVDVKNLSSLFKQLHFDIICHNNLGKKDMMETIRAFSSLPSHTSADMAVVCILSHGESHGNIITSDGQKLDMEWVLKQFNNIGCPGLHNKPKLFLLQACRGDEEDYGIPKSPNLTVDTTDHAVPMGSRRSRTISCTMPTWEDMLIAYAAVPGYVANRNHARGTWFIECFCQVLMEHSADLDLREMLDEVAKQLSNFETELGRKQSFSYEARHFYNKLYFNPGIHALEDHTDIVDNQREVTDNRSEEKEMLAPDIISTSQMMRKEEIYQLFDTRKEERDERETRRREDRNEREQIRQEERNERELIRKEEREEREKIAKEEQDEREKHRNNEKEQIRLKIKEDQKEMERLRKARMDEYNFSLMLSSMALVIAIVSFILIIKE